MARFVISMLLAICLPLNLLSAADGPEIEAAVRQAEVFVGDTIDYQVEIRNSKNPSAPDLTAIKKQFDVTSQSDESRNMSSTTIINGRFSQQNIFSHIYHYRLIPKTSGDLTIPAVTATIDGKPLSSSEISIRVIEPEQQDLVRVEIETSHERVFPTQPFTVTVKVLVRPLPDDSKRNPLAPLQGRPPHLQISWVDPIPSLTTEEDKAHWLQPLLAGDGIGFSLNDLSARSNGFFEMSQAAVFGMLKGRENRDGLDGSSIRYFVYELSRTFTPETTGVYSLGPATVKGTFVAGIEKREYLGRRLVAVAPAKTVEVREVPMPRPETFCGGIGDYRISAAASPLKLRVGDPLTLTLEIERGPQSGSLALVAAPDLSTIPGLIEGFDLIDRNPTGRVEGSSKKFAYALRPKQPNVSIPALAISTFDPESEKFVERQTEPIELDVSEASHVTAGDLIGTTNSEPMSTIRTRSKGIFQNVVDPTAVYDESIDVIAWLLAAAGVWCAASGVNLVVTVYRRKSSDTGWVRRQQARKTANRQLSEARQSLREGQFKIALGHVRSAIVGLVADCQNRIAEGLTTSDIAAALAAARVENQDQSAVIQLLESIESAEYGAASSTDPAAMIETASRLIARISSPLERSC